MKYWMRVAAVFLALGAQAAGAEELFPSGNVGSMAKFSELPSGTTFGGYPLYTGGRAWYLVDREVEDTELNVRILSFQLASPMDGAFFANMYVAASAGGATGEGYFSADLCSVSKSHLFIQNKSSGRSDNCVFIDPHVTTTNVGERTFLLVRVRNSQSSARLYDLTLLLDPEKLGFQAMTASDWNTQAITADPKKKQAFDKLVVWAKHLQEGVNKAIAFSKPQDAFNGVPPLDTLLVAE